MSPCLVGVPGAEDNGGYDTGYPAAEPEHGRQQNGATSFVNDSQGRQQNAHYGSQQTHGHTLLLDERASQRVYRDAAPSIHVRSGYTPRPCYTLTQ